MAAQTLQDKVVLITGGAKNLGGLISRKFAEQGPNWPFITTVNRAKLMQKKPWLR